MCILNQNQSETEAKMNPTKCNLKVNSPHVKYTDEAIETNYEYPITSVTEEPETGTYFVSVRRENNSLDYRFMADFSVITTNSTRHSAMMCKYRERCGVTLFCWKSYDI